MGKLICDFQDHKGEVTVDQACYEKVQKAVQDHLSGVRVGGTYGVLGQAGSKWHIVPQGPDWHISPTS